MTGFFDVLLGEIALVLGLQVDAPLHRELELLLRPLEHRDGLGVIHAHEFRADDPRELREQPLLDALVEEREIVLPFLEQCLEDVLQEPFGQRRVVRKVGESDLRLDHPELGEVAAGVRVLGAERRAEGVDLGQREAVRLDVELPGDGQERLAAEEVLREIDLPLRRARQVGEIQRRHPEHLARRPPRRTR